MAFKKVTPEAAASAHAETCAAVRGLRGRHSIAAADLLKLAENPADVNTALAAVAKWRADQRVRGEMFWRNAALMLIASGDDPDAVCSGFGFGRTALQRAVRVEPSIGQFADLLYSPKQKTKKAA